MKICEKSEKKKHSVASFMKKRGIMKNRQLLQVKANSHPQKAVSVPLNINKYYLSRFHQEKYCIFDKFIKV